MNALRKISLSVRGIVQAALSALLMALPWFFVLFVAGEHAEKSLLFNPFMVMFAHYPLVFLLTAVSAAMIDFPWWMAGIIDVVLFGLMAFAVLQNFLLPYLLFDLIFFAIGYFVVKKIRNNSQTTGKNNDQSPS